MHLNRKAHTSGHVQSMAGQEQIHWNAGKCIFPERELTASHICLNYGWWTYLRARSQIVYKFWTNSFECPWKCWRAK